MCKEYNGYTNYETWAVSLWIDNDQGLYWQINELSEDHYNDADNKEDISTWQLEDAIKEVIEENNPLLEDASLYSDLLQAAIDSVNWREIAENWIEVVKENNE